MGLLALAGFLNGSGAQEMPLRTAAEVQQLSTAEARGGRGVKLQAVVTFTWHTATTELTLEDKTGAVWCPAIALPFDCRVGTEVEIEGRTDAGKFGPFVHALTVRPIGPSALPPARRSTFDDLLSAPLNGRRVEISGIIRGQRMNPELGLDWLALEVATGGGRITVHATHETTGHPELIDATVRILGVNLHATDPQQQAFLPMIYANTLDDIVVVTLANPKPFEQPLIPLAELMRSRNVAGAGHRVRARGVVTYVGTGNSFYLEDDSRGTQVFLREALRPVQGETVDVVGFPEPGAFSPVLRDADLRPTDIRGLRLAVPVAMAEATRYDGRLITVQGLLTSVSRGDAGAILTLEDGNLHCRIHVQDSLAGNWNPRSIIRATGVCGVEIGDWESFVVHSKPIGFSLFAQNSQALELVQPAPWWNLVRVIWLLALVALSLAFLFAIVWWQTKSNLREAARARDAAQAQFSAVLSERARIAREIHDTLAQGLTGISAHLEVLNDRMNPAPPKLQQHLAIARDLVRSSLVEVRSSVQNLRSQVLEEAGLAEALNRLGHQLIDGSPTAFEVNVNGQPRPLPPDVENNLMRIGQEALTNAVRHSSATTISLALGYQTDGVRIEVSDNGKGFDPAIPGPSPPGGFGLAGIRERANAMHASVAIIPQDAGGVRITVFVPHV